MLNRFQRIAQIKNPLAGQHSPKERGWIAIETGLVLLVVTALVIAAVLFYRDNTRKQSINSNVTDVLFIGSNANAKYGTTNRFGEVTTELAVKSGVVPSHLRVQGTDAANNKFGGVIAFSPETLTGPNDSLRIEWPNVPENQCSDIITNVEAEFRQIEVGGTAVKTAGAQLDLAALENACDAGAPVDLAFFVGRF